MNEKRVDQLTHASDENGEGKRVESYFV